MTMLTGPELSFCQLMQKVNVSPMVATLELTVFTRGIKGVAVGEGVTVGVKVWVALGEALGVREGVAVGVAVGVNVVEALGLAVGLALRVAEGLALGEALGDAVGLLLRVTLGVWVLVMVGVGVLQPTPWISSME